MSRKTAFLLFNTVSIALLWYKGQLRWDWLSITAVIFSLALMNFIAWWSSRNFPQWQKPSAQPDRDEAEPPRKAIDTRSMER